MNTDLLEQIYRSGASIVVFDIDGTLKDLCEEHKKALNLTLYSMNITRIRKSVIKAINKVAMSMVMCGIFPTNKAKQDILLNIFSIISLKGIKHFKGEYYKFYENQLELFDGVKELLRELNKERKVFFATINDQNYNLEHCGISSQQIVYTKGILKVVSYKRLLDEIKVESSEVIIVGDNIFDDIVSAKLLKTKSVLVNNYNSKFKKLMCKLLNHKYL